MISLEFIIRDKLPDGLEFRQVDNSMTGLDIGGRTIEITINSPVPHSGGAINLSVVLTVVPCSGGLNAWENKLIYIVF